MITGKENKFTQIENPLLSIPKIEMKKNIDEVGISTDEGKYPEEYNQLGTSSPVEYRCVV